MRQITIRLTPKTCWICAVGTCCFQGQQNVEASGSSNCRVDRPTSVWVDASSLIPLVPAESRWLSCANEDLKGRSRAVQNRLGPSNRGMEDSETSKEKDRFMRNSFVNPEPGSSSQLQADHSVLRFLAVAAISAMAATTVARAAAPASPQGVITGKGFLDTGTGTAVTDLTGNAKFPNNPDVV